MYPTFPLSFLFIGLLRKRNDIVLRTRNSYPFPATALPNLYRSAIQSIDEVSNCVTTTFRFMKSVVGSAGSHCAFRGSNDRHWLRWLIAVFVFVHFLVLVQSEDTDLTTPLDECRFDF